MMTRILKWTAAIVVILAAVGFTAFLYFIPPLDSMAPEEFITRSAAAAPAVDDIADPAARAIAARGRYLVMTGDCTGCHTTPGPRGPDPAYYLAGGMKFVTNGHGAVVSSNLTPDRETGIGGRSDDAVVRALRSGVLPDGRVMPHQAMPWSNYSNWSDEDLHAVVAYLKHIKAVHHAIPAASPERADVIVPGAAELSYGTDAGRK